MNRLFILWTEGTSSAWQSCIPILRNPFHNRLSLRGNNHVQTPWKRWGHMALNSITGLHNATSSARLWILCTGASCHWSILARPRSSDRATEGTETNMNKKQKQRKTHFWTSPIRMTNGPRGHGNTKEMRNFDCVRAPVSIVDDCRK